MSLSYDERIRIPRRAEPVAEAGSYLSRVASRRKLDSYGQRDDADLHVEASVAGHVAGYCPDEHEDFDEKGEGHPDTHDRGGQHR